MNFHTNVATWNDIPYHKGVMFYETDTFFNNLTPEEITELRQFTRDGGQLVLVPNLDKGTGAIFTVLDGNPVIAVCHMGARTQRDVGGVFHHEFTHYKQNKRGDLTFEEDGMKWKGAACSTVSYSHKTEWEEEAWGAQHALAVKYGKTRLPKWMFIKKLMSNMSKNSRSF